MYVYKQAESLCPTCGWQRDPIDDPYDTSTCSVCGDTVLEVRECEPEWLSVAAYTTTREYGGPEEGGWYYDAGVRRDYTVRCFEAGDLPWARLYVEQLKREFREVRVYGDRLAPSHYPSRRPHYN